MAGGPPINISLDGRRVWIGNHCLTFEQAKQKAHEILDLINGEEAEKEIKATEDAAAEQRRRRHR